jgi:FixJ family two-component response regulator
VKQLPKVFVIDQNEAVLNLLAALLGAHGYEVKCFTSVEEFIAQHHPTQVGCVLVDLLMPGMGGSELLEFFEESGSILSVIVISSLIDSAASPKFVSPRVSVLKKPYEIFTLLAAVKAGVTKSLRRRAQRRSGSTEQ